MAWPDPLPAYMDRIYHGGRQFLLRPFTADSLVVEEVGDGRARLVLPLDGLVACRRAGCLWTEATLTGVRIRMLERASLDEALSGR